MLCICQGVTDGGHGRTLQEGQFPSLMSPSFPQPRPALVRAVLSFPPPFRTTASLPSVLLGLSLAGLTSPQRTRCGWGHGGSASWGLEQPHSSSPSPSWATPSASQISIAAPEESHLHLPLLSRSDRSHSHCWDVHIWTQVLGVSVQFKCL